MNFIYFYHDVSSEEEFLRTIQSIRNRYDIVSVEDMYQFLNGTKSLKDSCVFTIDDGWLSTYRYVFPVIKRLNIPITIFVSPQMVKNGENYWYYLFNYCNQARVKTALLEDGIISDKMVNYPLKSVLKELQVDIIYRYLKKDIGEEGMSQIPRGFVNKEELLELNECPLVTIGAHTMCHPILMNETKDRAFEEIKNSVTELKELLAKPVTTFAYPNGVYGLDYSEREMTACREAGINMAFSTDAGILRSKKTNLMSIPRCGSLNRLRLGNLGLMLPGYGSQYRERKTIRKELEK